MVSTPATQPMDSSPGSGTGSKRRVYHILAGKLFDSHSCTLTTNKAITVDRDSGFIIEVQDIERFEAHRRATDSNAGSVKGEEEVVDLLHLTVLPGFVDVHVHLFLHSYSETSWQDQLTKESLTERVLRASVHARKTLMMGFTTVRDLGTEGAGDADIALRKCLAVLPGTTEPIIVGPRYYCVTRAIVSTGSYGPKSYLYPSQYGVEGVTGAEAADGIDGCVRAVRRQVGAGADWIKIYADYRVRSLVSDVSPSVGGESRPLFTTEELEAMIKTAHSLGVKVAAHVSIHSVIQQLLDLGVDTIEHGTYLLDDSGGQDGSMDLIEKWSREATSPIWVPTLSVYYYFTKQQRRGGSQTNEAWECVKRSFQKVLEVNKRLSKAPGRKGIRIACGGDTGAFPHGENGLEMVLMRRLGADWGSVLSWATLGGWECVRGVEWEGEVGKQKIRSAQDGVDRYENTQGKNVLERGVPFGAIRKGWVGDLVGIEGTLDGHEGEFEEAVLRGVRFVMKGGVIYKQDGKEVL